MPLPHTEVGEPLMVCVPSVNVVLGGQSLAISLPDVGPLTPLSTFPAIIATIPLVDQNAEG